MYNVKNIFRIHTFNWVSEVLFWKGAETQINWVGGKAITVNNLLRENYNVCLCRESGNYFQSSFLMKNLFLF